MSTVFLRGHDPSLAYDLIRDGLTGRMHWTISCGQLRDPKHPLITGGEAEAHRTQDVKVALAATLRYCPVLATEPEGRLAAIVDFTLNLGSGRAQT